MSGNIISELISRPPAAKPGEKGKEMGYFDLPTGDFELLLKKKGRGNHKPEWQSVMFTDGLTREDIAECAERWGNNYKVMGARYNGREVTIPAPGSYHWEHRFKDTVYGVYKTRSEAVAAMQKRKEFNWAEKDKTKRIPVGLPYFVAD